MGGAGADWSKYTRWWLLNHTQFAPMRHSAAAGWHQIDFDGHAAAGESHSGSHLWSPRGLIHVQITTLVVAPRIPHAHQKHTLCLLWVWVKLCDWRRIPLPRGRCYCSPDFCYCMMPANMPTASHHYPPRLPLCVPAYNKDTYGFVCRLSHNRAMTHLTSNKVLKTLIHIYTHILIKVNCVFFFSFLKSPLIYLIYNFKCFLFFFVT